MADDNMSVLRDLKTHLQSANFPLENVSTLTRKGNDKLVQQFLTENIKIHGSGAEAIQSQLYIACFWGVREIVKNLLEMGADPNHQNKGTLWTPLHAATFQEHGPIVMLLFEYNAAPDIPDSEGRTPKDFASASDKIWPHFAVQRLERSDKQELIDKGIIKKITQSHIPLQRKGSAQGIRMAAYSRPESAYAYNSEPFLRAATTGDVLADVKEIRPTVTAPFATGGSFGASE